MTRRKDDPPQTANYEPGPWPVLERKELLRCPIFQVEQRTARAPRTGQTHPLYVIEAPDWVNVIPITSGGRVVMIRQYRHGTEELTLEIPGGMIDPDDPSPLEAARRELLEETGYAAGTITPIGAIAPNPAIQTNRCHSFIASNLRHTGRQELDGAEEIEVVEIPMDEIPQRILGGEVVHALVVVAFFFEQARRGSQPG